MFLKNKSCNPPRERQIFILEKCYNDKCYNDLFMSSTENTTNCVYDKNNLYLARMTQRVRLSKPGGEKETFHFVVDLGDSGLKYKCGDSLGVYPRNNPDDVAEVLAALGASGDEPVLLPRAQEPISLKEALDSQLSLSSPTKKYLEFIAQNASDPTQKEKAAALLAPEQAEACADFLAQRAYIDLLQEFPSARPSPQQFVEFLRKLMPRLYSIASSPAKHPNEIHLCVAIVRYQTNGRKRNGVCSSFMADRVEVGKAQLPVFVASSHFGLPENPASDLIMVGPGTGIAPFRAFMQERVATKAPGRNWVFFGDQRRAFDFLYEEEWEQYLREGSLSRLDLAFSRDQNYKIYVQDRLRENAAELWQWLQNGACFYVCGDAKRMAKDVDAALQQIAMEQGGLSAEQAAEYFKEMKKQKRYQRDVY